MVREKKEREKKIRRVERAKEFPGKKDLVRSWESFSKHNIFTSNLK